MAAAGVRVDVLPLETASGTDAQISELTAPAEVYEGQAVPLSVTIDANADMMATLVLYQNGEATDTREVSLKAGENRYAFSLTAQKTGVVTYEARLVSRHAGGAHPPYRHALRRGGLSGLRCGDSQQH